MIYRRRKVEVSAMRLSNLLEHTGLFLVGLLAVIILLPLIILSLEVVLITGFLMLIGALVVKPLSGAHHLRSWRADHRWALHRHSGPRFGVN
jgi:hypothetical protein